MRSVNWMGFGLQSVSIIALTILITYLVGWRWEAVVGAIDAVGIWAFNILIGLIVGRPYPSANTDFGGILVDLTKPSFPSGQATSYIGFYGFMFYLIYTRLTRPWLRIPLLIMFGALVMLVGPSRVYMGSIWLALTIYFYHWGQRQPFVRTHFKAEQGAVIKLKSKLGLQ